MRAIDLRNKLINIINSSDIHHLRQIETFVGTVRENEIIDEHKTILDNRLTEHNANPTAGRSWSSVKKELAAKYDL